MVDLCVGYAAPDMETPTAQLLRSYLLPARRVAEVREGSQARVNPFQPQSLELESCQVAALKWRAP